MLRRGERSTSRKTLSSPCFPSDLSDAAGNTRFEKCQNVAKGVFCLFTFLCKGKTAPPLEGSQSSAALSRLPVKRFDEKCSFRHAQRAAVPALRRSPPPPTFPLPRAVD